MKKLFLLVLLFSTSSFAAQDICVDSNQYVRGIHFQTGSFTTGKCFISISSNYLKMTYRNYLITSEGQMMIFNSYGDGPSSTHTGARVYHFFPYRSAVTYELTNDALEVTLTTGAKASFELEDGVLFDISSSDVVVSPDISRDNFGGVEITAREDIILDSGFKLGNTPVWYLNRKSTFHDSMGTTCEVKNSQVFEKKNSEIYLTIDNNKDLFRFLKQSCPDIITD